MNDILLATIPAALVLIATLGARFIEHWLQSEREIKRQELEKEREVRDAKRKYRETDVAPIKEALRKLGSDLEWVNLKGVLQQHIDEPGEEELDALPTFKKLKESIPVFVKNTPLDILTDMVPLIECVRSEDVKQALRSVFFEYTIFYAYAEKNATTSKDVKDKLDLAYTKLENYVAIAE